MQNEQDASASLEAIPGIPRRLALALGGLAGGSILTGLLNLPGAQAAAAAEEKPWTAQEKIAAARVASPKSEGRCVH